MAKIEKWGILEFLTFVGGQEGILNPFSIDNVRDHHRHYSTVESDLLNSLAWDIFYILSSTVGYKISTMGYKISTMEYKLYPTVELSTMGYKLLYPIVDKKYPTLSY